MTAAVQIPMVEVPERKRGVGVLELLGPQGRVELPLAGVEISATVSSFVAEVTVRQTFKNPHQEALEAEYVFPLAGGCAVSRFELKVAGRVVVGKVEERGEARRQYQQAIAEGKRAALLEQERSDVFTVKVGNLPPGEQAEVLIAYSERLAFFEDGAAELRLPLVVAPRYMAGAELPRAQAGSGVEADTDQVPDASRLSPPRLAEGFDPQVGLKIAVELLREDGEGFDDLSCSQHATRTSAGAGSIKVQLARAERLDRDFVLRWRMGGAEVATGLQLFKAKGEEGYALLTLVPPRREGFLGLPRDVVFVLDRSGSMSGAKMASAARACALLLRTLGPRDRYGVLLFDDRVDWQDGTDGGKRLLAADEAGLEKGEAFLRGVTARGGTELDLAMREALAACARGEEGTRQPIAVLLTDGQIGDESSVLKRLQTSLGGARVFTLGVDSAVNAGFLKRLAASGGGTATFVEPGAALEDALRAVGREIGAPLVTDLELTDVDAGADLATLAPAVLPDLFEGRASSVFFRAKKAGSVKVTGRFADGKKFSAKVKAQALAQPALAQLWARAQVVELEDRYRLAAAGLPARPGDTEEALKAEIVALACAHTLLTRFTAFVAVDQEVVNKGGQGRKVVQPVEMPAQWEREQSAMASAPVANMLFAPPPPGGPPPAFAAFDAKAMSSTGAGAPLPPPSPVMPSPSRARGPMRKSEAGGMAARLKRAVGGMLGGGGHATDKESREEEAAPKVSAAETKALREALAELTRALDALQAALAAGQVPAAGPLEQARTKLLQALSTSPVGQQVPALQRFLRSGCAELLAALKAKAGAKALTTLLARHRKAFDAARPELEAALGGAAAGGKEPWESSI